MLRHCVNAKTSKWIQCTLHWADHSVGPIEVEDGGDQAGAALALVILWRERIRRLAVTRALQA